MYRRILAATDGSEQSSKSVKIAGGLAAKYGATLYLAHVVKDYTIPDYVKEYIQGEKIQEAPEYVYIQSVGEKIIQQAEKETINFGLKDVKPILLRGNPAEEIVKYAQDNEVDLIVMGSHGLGYVKGILVGSVSQKICHLAPCDCYLVKT